VGAPGLANGETSWSVTGARIEAPKAPRGVGRWYPPPYWGRSLRRGRKNFDFGSQIGEF